MNTFNYTFAGHATQWVSPQPTAVCLQASLETDSCWLWWISYAQQGIIIDAVRIVYTAKAVGCFDCLLQLHKFCSSLLHKLGTAIVSLHKLSLCRILLVYQARPISLSHWKLRTGCGLLECCSKLTGQNEFHSMPSGSTQESGKRTSGHYRQVFVDVTWMLAEPIGLENV